jgi:hypothetical protein
MSTVQSCDSLCNSMYVRVSTDAIECHVGMTLPLWSFSSIPWWAEYSCSRKVSPPTISTHSSSKWLVQYYTCIVGSRSFELRIRSSGFIFTSRLLPMVPNDGPGFLPPSPHLTVYASKRLSKDLSRVSKYSNSGMPSNSQHMSGAERAFFS